MQWQIWRGIQWCKGTSLLLVFCRILGSFRPERSVVAIRISGALHVHLTTLEPPFRNTRSAATDVSACVVSACVCVLCTCTFVFGVTYLVCVARCTVWCVQTSLMCAHTCVQQLTSSEWFPLARVAPSLFHNIASLELVARAARKQSTALSNSLVRLNKIPRPT